MEQNRSVAQTGNPANWYSEAFKRAVVAEYESGRLNKRQIKEKYNIGGKSRVLEWCRKYGRLAYPDRKDWNGRPMKDPQKKRIKDLEKALALAEAKVKAYEKLIEITEREEQIDILKKSGAKQSSNSEQSGQPKDQSL